MAKTLQDWLETSSDEDDDATTELPKPSLNHTLPLRSPTSSSLIKAGLAAEKEKSSVNTSLALVQSNSPDPITPVSTLSNSGSATLNAPLSARDEIREKMKRYLGEAAVTKSIKEAAEAVASPATSNGKSFSNISMYGSSVGNADLGRETSFLREEKRSGASTGVATATDHFDPNLSSPDHSWHLPPKQLPDAVGVGFRAVEIMVTDRGTQTVSTVGVQTDPLPPPPFSTWYAGYAAPRMNSSSVPLGPCSLSENARLYREARGGDEREELRRDGTGSSFLYGNLPGLDYTSTSPANPLIGIDGRPYRQLMNDVEVQYSEGAKRLRSQLSMLQNNIDMLISRYNLPPPPNFRNDETIG